ncbi:Serpin B4 [Lamellibrachia satsuma]|nr:Serpin B4 [Lamellibrachia satsuma]
MLRSYVYVTRHYYNAPALSLPIRRYPEPCRRYINYWVKRRTDYKIVNLLPRGSVNKDTVLVLVNAITFKGYWEHKFTEGETKRERFYQSATRMVDMMHMACGARSFRYAYVRSISSQVVELPFYNSRIAMYIVLPRRYLPLSFVERRFAWDPSKLGLRSRKMVVSLPKFTAKKDTLMTPLLKALGMKDLFHRFKANLCGIAGCNNLWVWDVFHQAYINVHETGTEASAATAVAVCERPLSSRAGTFKFVANRPFLFFIWDRKTNSLLFNGRFRG